MRVAGLGWISWSARLVRVFASPRMAFAAIAALHLAAASGSGNVVTRLLDAGADANAREREWGQTPLMFAAAENREDVGTASS